MPAKKMHEDEVETSIELVQRLLRAQFPHWAELPLQAVPSAGTDNALYRLGNEMVVRLPRIHWAVSQAETERHWLPRLTPSLPLQLPVQLVQGTPAEGYPWNWSIYRWIEGRNYSLLDEVPNPNQAALDLAAFLRALQRIDTTDGPQASRGRPLQMRDASVREAIRALEGRVDTETATQLWAQAMQLPQWEREPVWVHGDFLPGNILFHEGRVRAVIDFSGLGVGDPACDLMIAWSLFSGESRSVFRTALGLDPATWMRGRAHALSQALIFIPYYWDTNSLGVARALCAVRETLADFKSNG